MALNEEEKVAARKATQQSAFVMADDLSFIRELLTKPFATTGDVRRIAVLLRRLLIEAEITKVAAPRIGRLLFNVPEYEEHFLSNPSLWTFYATSIPPMFGMPHYVLGAVYRGGKIVPRESDGGVILPAIDGTRPKQISVRLDRFLTHQIGRYDTTKIRQQDVIKYVCYKGYGVHTNGQDDPIFDMIEMARYCLTIRHNENTNLGVTIADFGRKPPGYLHSDIDIILLHLFGIAYYLCHSPDVQGLEKIISLEQQELSE